MMSDTSSAAPTHFRVFLNYWNLTGLLAGVLDGLLSITNPSSGWEGPYVGFGTLVGFVVMWLTIETAIRKRHLAKQFFGSSWWLALVTFVLLPVFLYKAGFWLAAHLTSLLL